MATRRRKAAPSGTIQVDFSKMKEGGGGVRVPEGDYLAKIISAKPDTSQAGNAMIVFTFEIIEGKYKGKRLVDRATLTEKALFKLRDILEALGINVPKKVVNIPVKKLVGREVGITALDDEPYNGRIKSKIADYISPDNLDEEDEDEDDDELDEEDDDEVEEEDDLAELDRAELKALIKEEELEVKVLKSMSDDDLREAITEARDEDEDEEDEEEEPEPAPKAKKSGGTKKPPRKKTKAASKDEDDEDEIEDIDLADL